MPWLFRTNSGLTATLKLVGTACNLYGTDIETLNLTVEYQSADRLAVKISPAVIDSSNASQYIIPDNIVQRPTADSDVDASSLTSDLEFVWINKPTFHLVSYACQRAIYYSPLITLC